MVEEKTKKKWELKEIFKDVASGVALGVGIGFLVVLLVLAIMAGSYGVKLLANLANQPVREAQAVATTIIEEKSVGTEEAAKETAATPETTATTETAATVETTAVETTIAETTATETTAIAKTAVSIIPEGTVPVPYETEGGLPTSDSAWSFDVNPKEIEVLTGGPTMTDNVKLPGGTNPDRGSVVIMLPSTKTIHYDITELVNGSNWHGAYDYKRIPTEADWKALKDYSVQSMMDPKNENGTEGKGCLVVDVVVVKGETVVFQETYYRK